MSFGIPVRNGLGVGLLASTSLSTRNGFSPASLFAAGEPGAWYDPSDLSTMFQDRSGTTPVTTPGQTVAVLLDKSQGLALGTNRAPGDGTFDSSTGWVLETGWAISGGVATASAGAQRLYTSTGTLVDGALYLVTVTVTAFTTAGTVYLGTNLAGGLPITATGTFTGYILCTGSERIYVGNGFVGSIDNISVRELAGNHARQATAASRPIYGTEPFGGRRNLLTYTEQFDNAAWSKVAGSISANSTTAPDGTLTADTFVPNTTATQHRVDQTPTTPAGAQVFSVFAKAAGYRWISLRVSSVSRAFDLQTGTVGTAGAVGTVGTITPFGDGWYRCTIYAPSALANDICRVNVENGDAVASTFAGDGTSGIYIWGAQLEVGSLATAYQRVTDQWNVTQAGVPSVSYLAFDGTDDWLVSSTITPGIDKAQVFAGVRKLSDAATGILVESGAPGPTGSITFLAPRFDATGTYGFTSRGTTAGNASSTSVFPAPITNVLTGIGDIAGDVATLRVNGVQAATGATDQGTGNYAAYPLYTGRRGGTALPYNGRIYSLITRFGANLSAATIAQTEAWVNGKTGAY